MIVDGLGGGTHKTSLTIGGGTLTLQGASTYSYGTTVSGGQLVLANAAGSATGTGPVVVSGGVLAGSGTAGGNVTIQAGGTLAPGGPAIGTMGITGSLSLAGLSSFRINTDTLANDMVTGISGGINYGGTLKITNLGTTAYRAGENWDLFSFSGGTSGAFSNAFPTAGDGTNLPTLSGGLEWSFNYGNGDLSIISAGGPTTSIWGAGSANWSSSGSWTNNTVPNSAGAGAVFNQTSVSAGTTTVTLDSPQTVGTIVLGDSTGVNLPTSYLLTGSTLTMNNNGSGATITVASGSHEIDAMTLVLADSTGLTVSGSGTLAFGSSSSITETGGSQSLTLNAPGGTLILSGTDSYSGGTNVEAGTLIVASNSALLDGSSLTVGAGGVFVFDPSQYVAGSVQHLSQGSQVVSPVPEPGTLALLLAGVIVGLAAWRRRRS